MFRISVIACLRKIIRTRVIKSRSFAHTRENTREKRTRKKEKHEGKGESEFWKKNRNKHFDNNNNNNSSSNNNSDILNNAGILKKRKACFFSPPSCQYFRVWIFSRYMMETGGNEKTSCKLRGRVFAGNYRNTRCSRSPPRPVNWILRFNNVPSLPGTRHIEISWRWHAAAAILSRQ